MEAWVLLLTVPFLPYDYNQSTAGSPWCSIDFVPSRVWTSGGLGAIRVNFQCNRDELALKKKKTKPGESASMKMLDVSPSRFAQQTFACGD